MWELLKQEGLEQSQANPTLYRLIIVVDGKKKVKAVCVVHANDLQFAGVIADSSCCPHLRKIAEKGRVKLQIEGPCATPEEYEEGYSVQRVSFLKTKYTFDNNELRISIDLMYVKELTELLSLGKKHSRKSKQTPCASSTSQRTT